MPTLFDREYEVLEAHRQEWCDAGHEGQWVVIHAESVLGFYSSFEAASQAGADAFGAAANFVCHRLWSVEPIWVMGRVGGPL